MSTDLKELAREISRARGCEAEVARRGERDVCEKPPVAFVCEVADGHEFYWPACAWHVNRYGPGVPLVDIVAALRQSGETS